ncbi:MAG TPA: ABC transporter ATP-binding protein, partial [Aggregatilineales bacterium]|nr:ABC transporter ATP-binding protein [Aggregatilineales bacterium]
GALDAEFRESMRAEIKELHIRQNATTVYVTHDQIEAMAMGDRIVVMSEAVVQQVGTPADVYHDPSNLFVARFIGSPGMNLLQGQYSDGVVKLPGDNRLTVPGVWKSALENGLNDASGNVIVGFRPEAAQIQEQGEINATVFADDLHGGYSMLHLELVEGEIVHARAARQDKFEIGTPTRFNVDPAMIRFFHPGTEMALQKEGTA